MTFDFFNSAQLGVVWLRLVPFSVHHAHSFLEASYLGVGVVGVVRLCALALSLDGLGERFLGLGVRLGDGLRPVVGVDGFEFEFLR